KYPIDPFMPAANVVLTAVPAEAAGGASGLFSTAQQLGGAAGAALPGTVFWLGDEGAHVRGGPSSQRAVRARRVHAVRPAARANGSFRRGADRHRLARPVFAKTFDPPWRVKVLQSPGTSCLADCASTAPFAVAPKPAQTGRSSMTFRMAGSRVGKS